METGSFIELQFARGKELYNQRLNIARLNSGRAAIWHAFRLTGASAIWIPFYQCDTVRDFLLRKNCRVKYYRIDSEFNPVGLEPEDNEAVLLVNYYGVMSHRRMFSLVSGYCNVIVDNSQAFFAAPVENAYSVYSARKFVGVPDGAYVIGNGAEMYTDEYPQGYSSDTSAFLLQRIEYGCEGVAYENRMKNEHRIDSEDVCLMSKLTHTILDGMDYASVINKRSDNFDYAVSLFADVNRLDVLKYYDGVCVPMVYPLVVEDDSLLARLLENKHFQGHWWSYLCDEMPSDSFEYWLSRYMIPITIDQRYGKEEIDFIRGIVG